MGSVIPLRQLIDQAVPDLIASPVSTDDSAQRSAPAIRPSWIGLAERMQATPSAASCRWCRAGLRPISTLDGLTVIPCPRCGPTLDNYDRARQHVRRELERYPRWSQFRRVAGVEGNATAITATQAFAQNPTGVLFLEGDVGRGKSWMAGAAARSMLLSADPRRTWYGRLCWVDDGEFFALHKAAMDAKEKRADAEALLSEAKMSPVLFWDDLWTQQPSEWRDGLLLQVFDYRRKKQLPALITTNRNPDVGGLLSSRRVASRIYGGAMRVTVGGPDWRQTR